MPEGDTVFLTCHRLHQALAGEVVLRGEFRHPRLAEVDVTGRTVREVRPVGKHLLVRFEDGWTLHSHLRMEGAWHLYPPGARWRRPAHQVRAVLTVARRSAVGFELHELRWIRTADEGELVGHLGPDLLAEGWDAASHAEAVRRLTADPAREIGAALLDQAVLAGLGNIYRTEVCFLLRRAPSTPVAEIDADRAVLLSRRLLLRNAWNPEQSTTGDPRRDARHWVYGRRRCLRCGGAVTLDARPGDRITYHCPHCQP
ncbi:DNA glycosylase [Saccharopolyspora sp. NFXS83]|uniref:DNA-formamidopyrimidine glycosylase family protein n=1 Tax=Saccharopolyspora sp. NFXS83 TaxID=2993560 RepID=UPI00224B3265|nr:DNA-formamidopyrimidine glycosylase family protein [Saccharopolyspora sp. NFXS83]MCX2732901.1 DNA glycosylase [Saccharopolyspora sp. NFXS83]